MSPILESIFTLCEQANASDVHLATNLKPRFRVRGEVVENVDFRPFDVTTIDAIAIELGLTTLPIGSSEGSERVRMTLLREGSIDGALTSPSGARYRFNIFRTMSQHAIALRRLDSTFRSFQELHLPVQLETFCDERDGLVIVSGTTGSGKSTTLATMIDKINRTRNGHVVTIEDPVEYIHASNRCIVNQRQVGRDARSFGTALVEALRQDPDVILVGEMRDLDTVRTALRAAETGHLVLSTLHSGDCAGAVERLISMFTSDEQISARRQLALVLRGICAQHLVPNVQRTTRYPACEILVNTPACANLIATGRSAQLYSVLETGRPQGMITLDASLAQLLAAGQIEECVASRLSHSPELLKGRLLQFGG